MYLCIYNMFCFATVGLQASRLPDRTLQAETAQQSAGRGCPSIYLSVNLYIYSMSVKRSTCHTHNNTARTTPQTNNHMNDPPHPTLNNAQTWRDDGAYHHPRPGGWPSVYIKLTFPRYCRCSNCSTA